ncbi:hypothetical protein ABBQ32_009971 [Trebouxia sp. C0010 RCD-2024]
MQNSGLVRLAHRMLTRPCHRLESCGPLVEGLPYECSQRSVSTETATHSSTPAISTDSSSQNSSSQSEQAAPQAQDSAKVAHANALRQLRRKWKAQHAEKLAVKAKADAQKAANKAVTVEGHRRNMAVVKELRHQIHEEKRRLQIAELAQRQALAAQFRSATQEIYSNLREQRRQDLLIQSKVWITPETLDARITEALENPIELYETALEKNPSDDF